MIHRILLSLFALSLVAPSAIGKDRLFACGAFNGWDVTHCYEFNTVEDGVFTLDLDLSGGAFKISTNDCSGISGLEQAWEQFDRGAYQTVGDPVANTPMIIVPGVSNINPPERKSYSVVVNFNEMTLTFDDGGTPPPSTPYSSTLPVLFINTDDGGEITSRDEYVTARWWFDAMGFEGMESIGSEDEPMGMQIRGRGNYTWTGFDKRPYRIKLDDKQKLAGLHSNRHFALQAHADDRRGFLRDACGFHISKQLGMPWTPDEVPVELMLNGRYEGLYFVTENIRVAPSRVNVVEQPSYATDPYEITGGWLVEIDNYDDDPHVTINDSDGNYIIFTYKTPEDLSNAQKQFLTSQMQEINRLAYGDPNSPALWDMLDIDCLARFLIVQEILDDYEAFHGSCYLYRQQGYDERWCFGPVWDFGSAFFTEKNCFAFNRGHYYQPWISQIYRFPEFQNKVKQVWREYEGNEFDELLSFIDEYVATISRAAQYDYRRWPQYGNSDMPGVAGYVKWLLSLSRTWLISQWGDRSDLELPATAAPEVGLQVAVENGALLISSPDSRRCAIGTPDGRVQYVDLCPGANRFQLPAGIYIVERNKYMIF